MFIFVKFIFCNLTPRQTLVLLRFKHKKNPVNQLITGFFVESPGIEPGSKQATKKLSTRLFSD